MKYLIIALLLTISPVLADDKLLRLDLLDSQLKVIESSFDKAQRAHDAIVNVKYKHLVPPQLKASSLNTGEEYFKTELVTIKQASIKVGKPINVNADWDATVRHDIEILILQIQTEMKSLK